MRPSIEAFVEQQTASQVLQGTARRSVARREMLSAGRQELRFTTAANRCDAHRLAWFQRLHDELVVSDQGAEIGQVISDLDSL